MKNLIKTLCLSIMLTSVGSVSAKDAESTILLTNNNQEITLDFLNSDEVIGMQFDLVLEGVNSKKVMLNSCLSGLPSSHIGKCAFLKNGDLRVLIFSPTNAVLDSGNIGTLTIKGNGNSRNKISFQKVKMVGPKSVEVKGSALIDFNESDRRKL